jgi:cellulose synthase operon protein C
VSLGAILLAASLWPFGRGAPAPATVADATPQAVVATAPPPTADPVAAAEAYAAFLASPAAADQELRLTAMRRLADLRLEAAELALMDARSPGAELDEAIRLYRALLADPEARDAAAGWQDHWSYQLARAEAMAGRDADAEAVLAELVSARPQSPLAPEAWFRIGEARFMARDWWAAGEAYRETLRLDPAGPFAEQSHYKLGWTFFKQSLHAESFAPFAQVIEGRLSESAIEALDTAGRELVDDSFRAMSIGFASLDGSASADAWLDQREGPEPEWSWLLYARLGELYLEQQRWTDAGAAFVAGVERHPMHAQAPELQGQAVDALVAGNFAGEALAAMVGYAERFSLHADWWQGRAAAAHGPVRERLKQSLDTLATHHHAAFQQGSGSAAEAAGWYRRWLDEFPAEPEAPEQHFLLAELYFGDGRMLQAAEAYEAVAYGYGDHPRAAEAGYAAVVARRDIAAAAPASEAAESAVVDAALAFSGAFGADPRAAEVEFEAAGRLMQLGRLEAAREAAARVLVREEAAPELRAAAVLLSAHAAFELGLYEQAEQGYAYWLEAPAEPALAGEMRERLAASIYRQGEAAAAHADIDTAVLHFSRIRAAAPGSGIAAAGQHDAATLLFGAERWTEAADAYEVFLAHWPEHGLAREARVSRAAALVETGDAARAAPALIEVSRLEGQPEELRRAALWQAAELYEGSGDASRAEQALRDYLASFPAPFDAAIEARHRLAEAAGRRGDAAERGRWLAAMIEADRAAGETATARSRTLAAQASLELALPAVTHFDALPLAPPLERSVPEKAARMRSALDALGKAAGYGIADVTTEAAFRMAELYRGMAVALLDSARPPGLDEDALEQYELLLEEQAFPFEEDAIAIHEANAARARDGLYDRWVIASFEKLAGLVPARWDRQEAGENVVELRR